MAEGRVYRLTEDARGLGDRIDFRLSEPSWSIHAHMGLTMGKDKCPPIEQLKAGTLVELLSAESHSQWVTQMKLVEEDKMAETRMQKIKVRLEEVQQILDDVHEAGLVEKAASLVSSLVKTVERYAKEEEGPDKGTH